MTFVADQDPSTIEWARTPPPHMLEALETLYGIFAEYRRIAIRDGQMTQIEWVGHSLLSYQTAYNLMLRAFIEEYAP